MKVYLSSEGIKLILSLSYNKSPHMNLAERLQASRSHYSHPSHVFGSWGFFSSQYPLLNDYINSCILTFFGALTLYITLSSIFYLVEYVWCRSKFTPKELENKYEQQTYYHDIKWSILNIAGQTPIINIIKIGYPYFSKIQYSVELKPILLFYLFLHVVYDEFFTYWMHRILHHPKIYRYLHSIHHQSKAVTPFTGFAFHPLDAFLQAVPVFTSCYFIPVPIDIILLHGLATSVWAFSIHDNVNMVPFKGILYAGSHSIHHYPWGQNYNYGKFTSVCDRLYGTYCDPQGITGYGYEYSSKWQSLMNSLNKIYVRLIPDQGKILVQKIRSLHMKKVC